MLERSAVFDRIGGAETIDRLVEKFYERMDTLPEAAEIRTLHADDLTSTKDVLKRYLGEWTGGPKDYSSERGHPRLRRRHLPIAIGIPERDAWLLCMAGALEETVADEEARTVLYSEMASLADWMRNQGDNPHDQQRPDHHHH
ncbi:group II truncated hemoglobin [Thalassospira sp. MA62]|nr:group II truncated hemoglobin [Thalassospira sp. MA62]